MGESYFWKPFAQGVATPIVLIGGTNLLLKDFKVSNPYLYWGGLAASSAIVVGILADKIKVPILNAEGDSWDGSTGDDFRKYDDMELTEKDHEIILEEIESGLENYPADNLRNAKASAVSQINWFGIDKAQGDYDAETFNAEKKPLARNTIKAKGRNSYDRFKHIMEMKVKSLSPHFKKKYAKENRLPSFTSGGTTRYWQAFVDGWREMENAKVKDMGDVIGLSFKPENAFSVNEYWGRIDGADAYMDWRMGKNDTSGYYSKAYFLPTEEYDFPSMNAETFNAEKFKRRKIDAETRKKVGKAVADELADGFHDIMWAGLENGHPMTEKGFVDNVRIGCDKSWPLESDFREMRIVLEGNGYYDGWNVYDYEEPYTDEYLLKTMWPECKRHIVAKAKQEAPKIVAQAKEEYGDKYDAETFNSDSHTDSFMADMPVNAVKNNDGWYIPSIHRRDYKETFKNWSPNAYPYEKRITQDSVNEGCNSCGKENVHYQFYLARTNSVNPKMRFVDGATHCHYDTNTCGGNICGDCADNASCENCGGEICSDCEQENNYDHSDLVCVDCREFNESLEDD